MARVEQRKKTNKQTAFQEREDHHRRETSALVNRNIIYTEKLWITFWLTILRYYNVIFQRENKIALQSLQSQRWSKSIQKENFPRLFNELINCILMHEIVNIKLRIAMLYYNACNVNLTTSSAIWFFTLNCFVIKNLWILHCESAHFITADPLINQKKKPRFISWHRNEPQK